MHEYSLARAILTQAQTIAAAQGGAELREVVVSLGPLSGVEPLLLEIAFQQIAAERALAGAHLTIESAPLAVQCRACGATTELADFTFRCGRCGGSEVQVISGEQLLLRRVELFVAEPKEAPLCRAK